jgi:hypothetical protein
VEPRVYVRDAFAITFWTYYEPVPPSDIAPPDYANALTRLHAGLRRVEVRAPHFTDRVAEAQRLVADAEETPDLAGADRNLLSGTLSRLSTAISSGGTGEQLLHGEPHPGNLLRTRRGPLFVDLETCCRGPVEFDLAHAPEDVGKHYPGANGDLIRQCRILMQAMVTTWRWQRDDQLPNGTYWRIEGLRRLRAALDA